MWEVKSGFADGETNMQSSKGIVIVIANGPGNQMFLWRQI